MATGTVECCLTHGLRKRALGLFKNSTTTALLQKVSKTYEPAGQVVKLLNETEQSSDFRYGGVNYIDLVFWEEGGGEVQKFKFLG